MKKRFSSLNLKDVAAWGIAIATYAALAGAGLMIAFWRNREPGRSRIASHPPAHT